MLPLSNTPPHLKLATSSTDPVLDKITALLTPYNQKNIPISANTKIMADLEIDSVAIFDLVMEVEDTYDVTFPMETISDIETVGDLINTITTIKAN